MKLLPMESFLVSWGLVLAVAVRRSILFRIAFLKTVMRIEGDSSWCPTRRGIFPLALNLPKYVTSS